MVRERIVVCCRRRAIADQTYANAGVHSSRSLGSVDIDIDIDIGGSRRGGGCSAGSELGQGGDELAIQRDEHEVAGGRRAPADADRVSDRPWRHALEQRGAESVRVDEARAAVAVVRHVAREGIEPARKGAEGAEQRCIVSSAAHDQRKVDVRVRHRALRDVGHLKVRRRGSGAAVDPWPSSQERVVARHRRQHQRVLGKRAASLRGSLDEDVGTVLRHLELLVRMVYRLVLDCWSRIEGFGLTVRGRQANVDQGGG